MPSPHLPSRAEVPERQGDIEATRIHLGPVKVKQANYLRTIVLEIAGVKITMDDQLHHPARLRLLQDRLSPLEVLQKGWEVLEQGTIEQFVLIPRLAASGVLRNDR